MIANAARTRDEQTELLARLQRSSWQKHSSPSPGRDSCMHTSDNCMLTRKFREQVRITATSPETTVSNDATNTQVHVYLSWYVISVCALTVLGPLHPLGAGSVTHLLLDGGVEVGLAVVVGVCAHGADVVARTLVTLDWATTVH